MAELFQSVDPSHDFELLEILGKGSYGRVYRAKSTKSGEVVAVKVLIADEEDGDESQALIDLRNEIGFLTKLRSQFVVDYKGFRNWNKEM